MAKTKKRHWTQTPKGRAHMKALSVARHAAKETRDHGSPPDFHVAYAFGSVERWLHIYEDSHQLPRGSVAHHVGVLLSGGRKGTKE